MPRHFHLKFISLGLLLSVVLAGCAAPAAEPAAQQPEEAEREEAEPAAEQPEEAEHEEGEEHEDEEHEEGEHEEGEHDHEEGSHGEDLSLPDLEPADLAEGERLNVVATSNIIGDVAANIGAEQIELTVLMAPGQDPHTYEASPQDIAALEAADIVLVNGLGYEEGLLEALEAVEEGGVPLAPVSAGNSFIAFEGDHDHEEGEEHEDEEHEEGEEHEDEEHEEGEEHEDEHEHSGDDPHTWTDPANVIIWSQNIAEVLSARDPANAEAYEANAEAYIAQLEALDEEIEAAVADIPEENRVLVTDHEVLGYFAEAYGFEVVDTIIPAATTSAEPSAADLADLIEVLEEEQVPAIFVSTTVSDEAAQVIAEEVGFEVAVLPLYTESVGPSGSGAETYITMMQANVASLVQGLAP